MSDQYRHVIAHSTSSCQGHLWHERMAYFACLLHAFHNVYHKHAFTKSCLCRLSSGRCRTRACAAPGLILLEQGLRLFSDHVASCCGNVRPEMHNDIIDPAHPIIVWVFGISHL